MSSSFPRASHRTSAFLWGQIRVALHPQMTVFKSQPKSHHCHSPQPIQGPNTFFTPTSPRIKGLGSIAQEPHLEFASSTEPGRKGLLRRRGEGNGSSPTRAGTRGDICPEPISRLHSRAPGEGEVLKGTTLWSLRDNGVKIKKLRWL